MGGILGNDQIMGPLRALVPAGVAFLLGRYPALAPFASDIDAGILAVLAAIWSFQTNSPAKPTT